MITGLGTDIIEVSRIKDALLRHASFEARIFTAAEREYCSSSVNSAQRYAGRFAAKEAVAKCLGSSLSWLDVEIIPGESGKPEVRLYNKAAQIAGERRVMVSISHCHSHAVATAIAVPD